MWHSVPCTSGRVTALDEMSWDGLFLLAQMPELLHHYGCLIAFTFKISWVCSALSCQHCCLDWVSIPLLTPTTKILLTKPDFQIELNHLDTLNSVMALSLVFCFLKGAIIVSVQGYWVFHGGNIWGSCTERMKTSTGKESSEQMNLCYFLELQTLLHGSQKQTSVSATSSELVSLQDQITHPKSDICY